MKLILTLICTTSLLFAEAPHEVTFTNPMLPQMEPPANIQILPKSYKSPFLTVVLSFILPGLGHAYLEEYATAGALFGAQITKLSLSQSDKTHKYARIVSPGTIWDYGIFYALLPHAGWVSLLCWEKCRLVGSGR